MKVAVVHDWLVTYAGAERVLEQILQLYPQADVFSLLDFIPAEKRGFLLHKTTRTSFIQKLPWAKTKYRNYLPLMPLAIEQFDLSQYDLILSSSHAVAKGVMIGPDQLHISYVHSPMRYAWDMQSQYLQSSGLARGVKSLIARYILHQIRKWDVLTANRVDVFVANSNFIKKRIEKIYRRDSTVIFPPVATTDYLLCETKEDYYLVVSRLVPYKKIDLMIEAFIQMPDKVLKIVGTGPELKKLTKQANHYSNIEILGYQPSHKVQKLMQRAKAFVFASVEDFGIVTVEAQSCGTPVIALAKGGSKDTVLNYKTGLLFKEQTAESLKQAVSEFERLCFDYKKIREHALVFSNDVFKTEFKRLVDDEMIKLNEESVK